MSKADVLSTDLRGLQSKVACAGTVTRPGAAILPLDTGHYRIEKNVPVPARSGAAGTYPFLDMAPGDSFMVPCHDAEKPITAKRLSTRALRFRKANGMAYQFTCRAVQGGVRCWRTK